MHQTTLGALLDGRARPMEADYDKLVSWLARHGQPDPIATLAQALRAKRRTVALILQTLAGQVGVDVAELDAAITGRPVPPVAAEQLAAWTASA